MLDFQNIPQAIEDCGKDIATYTSQYKFLDSMTKVIVSGIAGSIDGKTEAEKTRKAYADPAYQTHLEAVKDAEYLMLIAKTYMDSLQALHAYYMSTNSTERARINLR